MCAIEDAEPAQVWLNATVKAVKPWRCVECRRPIGVGEQYNRTTLLQEGVWRRIRTCAHCWAAARWLAEVCGGYVHGVLLGELLEHWEQGYRSVGFARLIAGVRGGWNSGEREAPDAGEVVVLAGRMVAKQVAA